MRRLIGGGVILIIATLLYQQYARTVQRTQLLALLYDRVVPCGEYEECPLVASLTARVEAVKAFLPLESRRICGMPFPFKDCFHRPDLSRIDLSEADLRGADLHYVTLTYANLSGADLRGTDFHDTNLRRANLRAADLGGARLLGTDLRGACADEYTKWPDGFDWAAAGVITEGPSCRATRRTAAVPPRA